MTSWTTDGARSTRSRISARVRRNEDARLLRVAKQAVAIARASAMVAGAPVRLSPVEPASGTGNIVCTAMSNAPCAIVATTETSFSADLPALVTETVTTAVAPPISMVRWKGSSVRGPAWIGCRSSAPRG